MDNHKRNQEVTHFLPLLRESKPEPLAFVPIPSVLEPAGYAPFERGEIQRRTGQAYQADGTPLLDGLHHHDGRRGIDQHF